MYRGQSIGRLVGFLSAYWTVTKAHDVIFMGDQTIRDSCGGEPLVASFTWEEHTDIPNFVFESKYEFLIQRQTIEKEVLLNNYGWLELDPDDRFVGTTGKFKKVIKGRFITDAQLAILQKARDAIYSREESFSSRFKTKE
jgi:hypothetical protein